MIKKIGIVSLSRGIIGESFVKHEIDIGIKRLKDYGLEVSFLDNSLKGLDYLKDHPEKRAEDLIQAFKDDSIDMILCAIGGDDTYRLLPYLFDNNELKNAVKNKIFLGFSDTTINHLMLHKVGLNTFYGQSFLADICDIGKEMLPYTKYYFEKLIKTGRIDKIEPSKVWNKEREDFSIEAVGIELEEYENEGFILLQGRSRFSGKILGGCIDSLFDIFNNERYEDTVLMCQKYQLFPSKEDWKDKILLIETSEEKPTPVRYQKQLEALKSTGVFDVVSGVLVGKPAGELYFNEYQEILKDVIDNKELPIVYNINVGHAAPRCIIPFGVMANVDVDRQIIEFDYDN